MNRKLNLALIILCFVIALVIFILGVLPSRAQVDPCDFWDSWTGLPRFSYAVDSNGKSNLPDDVQNPITGEVNNPLTITVGNGGIWKYYSPSEKAYFDIVFRDWNAGGIPPGNHDICAYEDK